MLVNVAALPASAPEPVQDLEAPKDTTETPQPGPTEPVPVEEEEERPFIHGRHTCDSCLTTPIVGKRYHALNMSDYDLCAKCFSNYSGGEIQFEAVELG